MNLDCFIHSKQTATSYCQVCKRPICNDCYSNEKGVCPRCSNFTHNTIKNYNKKTIKLLIPFIILRIVVYWNIFVLVFFSDLELRSLSTGITILSLMLLPFIINIVKYGFVDAVKYQFIGKRNAILIADNKSWKTSITWISGILMFIFCVLFIVFITPIFIITDIIHFIVLLVDYRHHSKSFLTETEIRNLGSRRVKC